MKNLFYVCLIAIVSLGSTGFTTVEENESLNSNVSEMNCFDYAWASYDWWSFRFGNELAYEFMNYHYEACLDAGGCEANC